MAYHYLSRATLQSIQKNNFPKEGFHLPTGYNYCNKNLLQKMYKMYVHLFFKMLVGEKYNKSFMSMLILLLFIKCPSTRIVFYPEEYYGDEIFKEIHTHPNLDGK